MTIHFHRQNSVTLAHAYPVFFEALKSDSIEVLVQTAWEFFGLPVLLTDENYKRICQYPKKKLGQPIWDALLENSALSLDIIQDYQRAYLNTSQQYYPPFYSNQGPAADCPRIFGEVHSEERIYGHIAIFMFDCPLLPEDLPATQVFIDALTMLMLPRRNREGASLGSYMRDLLDETAAPNAKALANRCLSSSIPGPFSVMVTPIGSTASQQAFATMAISKIATQYRSTVSTIYHQCIVTLFGLMQGEIHSEKEIAFFHRVAEFLSPSNASSGVSLPFSDLSELNGHFQQAYMTALLTKKPCEFFADAFPAVIFETVCVSANVKMFLHPALQQLEQYDAEHQTEYFRTLQVYSLTLHNKESTARILCIHRNTLLYRLGKISELFHIPFEDQQTALALLNSFQLYGVNTLSRTDFGLDSPHNGNDL